tara:strand:+ start:8701 stop:10506 length:1806 start_codon:yes stop_codon:yes gene_type:complete
MINRFIGEWSDLIQVDATKGMSLVDLIKASFSGDRSAAGRYAAQQRWKNHQKKTEKPKDDGTPPIDPKLAQAKKMLEDAFKGDVISALRLAGTRQGNEQTGISVDPNSGISTNRPPRKDELLLAKEIEAAGALIDEVIESELEKLESEIRPKKIALSDKISQLNGKQKQIQEKYDVFNRALNDVVEAPTSDEAITVLGQPNPEYTGSELRLMASVDTVQYAVLQGQRNLGERVRKGEIDAVEISKMSDEALLDLVSRKTSPVSYGTGDQYEVNMKAFGDSALHSPQDLSDDPPYTREQKNQAFLTLMRQGIDGKLGETLRSEAPKLPDRKEFEKNRNALEAARAELKPLVITPAQRQAIVKKALSDLGVEFGKAGQVPVAMQGKKIQTSGFSLASPKKETRSANETPRGRKFQGLIDEAVQLLPKKLWEGSERPNTLNPGSKMAAKIELDIKNGRAHAQRLQANLGVSMTTKLKLNSLKLNEEPSTEWRSVALHEMGHAAENGNTWLTQMEYAYWESRKGQEPVQRLSTLTGNMGYKYNEIASKDKWAEPYAGKVYDQSRLSSFEIFTMGIENVFYGTRKIDPDHRAFTLGLLALSTQVKD